MATQTQPDAHQRVMQLSQEMGDLRESIGAARVRHIEPLEARVRQIEQEMADLTNSLRSAAPVAPSAPPEEASRERPNNTQPKSFAQAKTRRGSVAGKIVKKLRAEPEREFGTHEIAEMTGVPVRKLYATLSRLARGQKASLTRVSEGVFKARI